MEEKYLCSIFDDQNNLIKKAISEHSGLKHLFNDDLDHQKRLSLIEDELESHIRFKELVLFNGIQSKATQAQLLFLEQFHSEEKFNSFFLNNEK